jgi:hypothetical protein
MSIVDTYDLVLDEALPSGEQEPLTRYEFVATLESALAQLEQLVRSDQLYISRGDYLALSRLVEQFDVNIGQLAPRVANQDERVTTLEMRQFSPVARLNGEVVVALTDQLGTGRTAETTLQHRARFTVNASFSGRDRLQTQLAVGGAPAFGNRQETGDRPVDATGEGALITSLGGDTDGQIALDRLVYEFPISDAINGYVSATGGLQRHYVHTTANPGFDNATGGKGSLSAFSQFSPIYSIGGGAGLGIDATIGAGDRVAVSLGYLADQTSEPTDGSGAFNGDYAVLAQVSVIPTRRFQLGATYVRGFHSRGDAIFDFDGDQEFFIGSGFANHTHTQLGTSATTDSFGLQTSYRVTPSLTVNAFGGYTDVDFQEMGNGDIWYYGLNLSLPNLFLPNSAAGITLGVEPYLGGVEGASIAIPNATSLHLEAFYRLQITRSISFTPGFIWLTEPNQGDRPGVVIGTLRTTFQF